jgi:hypothetical protein
MSSCPCCPRFCSLKAPSPRAVRSGNVPVRCEPLNRCTTSRISIAIAMACGVNNWPTASKRANCTPGRRRRVSGVAREFRGSSLPLRQPSDLHHPKMRSRILRLSDGVTSRICRLLEAAAIRAIVTGRERIDLELLTDDLATLPLPRVRFPESCAQDGCTASGGERHHLYGPPRRVGDATAR